MANDTRQALCVYSTNLEEGSDWTRIGLAFPHLDGKGYDILLKALPIHARLVLRAPATAERTESKQLSLARQVEDFERALIEQCLLESGGKISAVIDRLAIPRRTLSEKMSRLGIDRRRLANEVRANSACKSLKPGNGQPTQ